MRNKIIDSLLSSIDAQKARNAALEAEIEAMKHDLGEYVRISSEQAQEICALEARVAELEEEQRWGDIKDAPRDSTMLRLLVDYSGDEACHALEDSDQPSVTIGFNQFDHTGEDEWFIAGWNWQQDRFTQGHGTPIGWMPLLEKQVWGRA